MQIAADLLQFILFILLSPLLSGFITKIKNNLRMRKGASVLQPYYNLEKLFSKGEVISDVTSWIFRVTPFIVLSSSLAAVLLIPSFITPGSSNYMGDFLALIFILSVGRFFLALAGLDAGSAFGGMGASREMFISSLVEPVACLVIFSLSMQFGSTNISLISNTHPVSISSIIAAGALFLVLIAETSRIPVDNQETHLELTMIHEAMVLEYSGRSLALIELATYIKQMIWFSLIAAIIFPASYPQSVWGGLWQAAGITISAVIVAVVEILTAKMRLFRVIDFLGFAFVLASVAAVCAVLGV